MSEVAFERASPPHASDAQFRGELIRMDTDTLNHALMDGEHSAVVEALRRAALSRGMSQVSRTTGFNRENLYRMLGPKGNPRMKVVLTMLESFGLRLEVHPKDS